MKIDIYKNENTLDKAKGVILINYGMDTSTCEMIYDEANKTGYVQYSIYASTIETAQIKYKELLPEILRKEKRFKAMGIYDHRQRAHADT